MVQLADEDIRTREVLTWKGVHLLHFQGSSCSQKVRIFLALKGVDWTSHPIDLARGRENCTPWFLGINPRGLVPVLVHDGAVHIESNDILTYVDEHFDGPRLIPIGMEQEIEKLLFEENSIHLDLRNLTMRYVAPRRVLAKTPAEIEAMRTESTGTVNGEPDPDLQREIDYHENFARRGVEDEAVRASAGVFRRHFDDFELRLANHPYLLGADLSLVDIAWFIYASRVVSVGYPLAELHPRLGAWHAGLMARPEFTREVAQPPPLKVISGLVQLKARLTGKSLRRLAGF